MYIVLFIVFLLLVNLFYNYWNYKQCAKHIKRFQKWLYEEDFKGDYNIR